MIRSLLVPLDGSTFGEHALPLALSLARKAGATVHLAHVHQVAPPPTVAGFTMLDSLDLHLRQDEQAYLADATRRIREQVDLPVDNALLDGEVAPALREFGAKKKVDLIVMSTHGRGALGRFWLGSVADDLLREPPSPVLLIHPQEGRPDIRREVPLKSILITLDGTPLSEQAIESAFMVGQPFESRVTLVRVIKPVIRPTYLPEGTSVAGITHSVLEEIHTLQETTRSEAVEYLEGIARKLRPRGIEVATRVVIDENPASAILREAQFCKADLIVMETHGRRGLKRMFLGSVADKVVRNGNVPVLLNRPVE
jgi:nucleotide-binding universal stress UspA family protein